jgi:hypothetical protein
MTSHEHDRLHRIHGPGDWSDRRQSVTPSIGRRARTARAGVSTLESDLYGRGVLGDSRAGAPNTATVRYQKVLSRRDHAVIVSAAAAHVVTRGAARRHPLPSHCRP